MRSTAIERRAFLIGVGASALFIGSPRAFAKEAPLYISAADDRAHAHFAVGVAADGTLRFRIPLPARGHGAAARDNIAVLFGRRPGTYAAVIDTARGELVKHIRAVEDRSFEGHGAFSADGSVLFATEHDDTSGAGLIGVYDTRSWSRLGEFAAGGIGPHEIRLMPDGSTLVVCVGGILTDGRRDMLNLGTMEPSLAYLDAASGKLLEQVAPPDVWHQLSIRHMDVIPDGTVGFGMQYMGDEEDRVPLVALHRRGSKIAWLRAGEVEERRLKQYIASVAFDAAGARFAATGPRGNVAASWDVRSGVYLGAQPANDVAGIAQLDDGFLISGGDGLLRANGRRIATDLAWDNHLTRVSGV